jgi:hypothetical protein
MMAIDNALGCPAMAPPKRKTGGGRVTPKGTQPSARTSTPKADGGALSGGTRSTVEASSRYTPKATRRQLIPPSWIPIIMVALLVGGGLVIMSGYLIFDASRLPTLIGLVMIMAGLFAATKWE